VLNVIGSQKGPGKHSPFSFDYDLFFFNLKTFRLLITWLATIEIVSTAGIAHPTFFAAYIHARSLMYHLLSYSAGRSHGYESKDKNLNRATDILIYQTYGIAITVSTFRFLNLLNPFGIFKTEKILLQIYRKYMDVASWCVLSSGVAFGVLGNYSVIKLYGKMPILIYMYSVLLAVMVPLIMGALMPLAALVYESAEVLLHSWKSVVQKRKSARSKTLRALKPIGFNIGGFFTFKRGSIGSVFEQLMDYTVNARLCF